MKTPNNETLETTQGKNRPSQRWTIVSVVVLIAAFAALAISLSPGVASADDDRDHRIAHVTFTKWVITVPANPPSNAGIDIAGVAGGDVGPGRWAGKVLDDDLSVPGFWLGHARYEFYGKKHSLIADVHVTQNNTTGTAVITGVVTKGWLKGSRLTGEYTVMPMCPIPTPGNVFGTLCFQGTLDIQRGDRD